MTPTTPHPKWRIAVVALAVLALCYCAAGTPPASRLLAPSVISAGLALKPITYHWLNRFDRTLPEADLYASRFYVLLLAALNMLACGFALHAHRSAKRFAFVLACALVMLAVLVNAQIHAFYQVA
ncbi:hypothetical protein NUV25_16135 [Burkholderia pseudomultivorans]|uniref:hypothetical protein n=1 Tax=Burkholderia pseudomultivorans TaxID=1207504 RepID=UPI0028754542|nr:hypothetical protein [Burkholderia pseudomultivorans]MDS0859237.1 hypothetical protein [Burkholderia pseudomultivorans]